VLTDSEVLAIQPSQIDLEKTVLDDETRLRVSKTLGCMNPLYRYALIMKYMDGLSVKEIARVLGRSGKAMDGVLQRAKAVFEKMYLTLEGGAVNHEG